MTSTIWPRLANMFVRKPDGPVWYSRNGYNGWSWVQSGAGACSDAGGQAGAGAAADLLRSRLSQDVKRARRNAPISSCRSPMMRGSEPVPALTSILPRPDAGDEQGLPLMRSANTGISGMIDPLGRITASLPLGQAGFVDADLPLPLAPTVYSRMGTCPCSGSFSCWPCCYGACRGRAAPSSD